MGARPGLERERKNNQRQETPRLSNVCHQNRGDNNDDNKEADYDDRARLDSDFPAATHAVSFATLQLSFSWLHSTVNNDNLH